MLDEIILVEGMHRGHVKKGQGKGSSDRFSWVMFLNRWGRGESEMRDERWARDNP